MSSLNCKKEQKENKRLTYLALIKSGTTSETARCLAFVPASDPTSCVSPQEVPPRHFDILVNMDSQCVIRHANEDFPSHRPFT